jgi:2-oxoisovalerate dehydrogenase E2 component (dihydrolipoyl transacylase)
MEGVKKDQIQKEDKVIKITGFQKAMTKTMTLANQIPSFLYSDEYNVDKLVNLRKEINKTSKIKLTYMPFIIKAVSLSLQQFPILNSHVNPLLGEDGFIYEYTVKKDHNIAVAIDSADGLIVPNIKSVQNKDIIDIQKDLYNLREKVEAKKLSSDDLYNGTFTISNIGNIGGKVLNPVILPPQACIIGISKILDALKLVTKDADTEGSILFHLVENKDVSVIFHKSMNMCISADHRIIDGATVARFSEVFRSYIENPLKILVEK